MIDRPTRAKPKTITQLTTDAETSTAIQCADWDYADVVTVLAAGSGNATYKFQVAYTYGGTKIDVVNETTATATITRTAAGTYADRIPLGAAVELYVTSIDLETSTPDYTLDATVYMFNRG